MPGASDQERNSDEETNVAWKSSSVSVTKVLADRLASLLFKRGRKGCFEEEDILTEEVVVSVELSGVDGGLFARCRNAVYDASSAMIVTAEDRRLKFRDL